MNNLQVERTLECVKNIVDSNRCALCDKADGLRIRYACGHTACDDCVISAEECLLCLTPPQTSTPYKVDDILSKRVQNSSALLKACQHLFNTDVYKHQRLSAQLRIEKELFPQCIQAPMKYENKRKSIIKSSKDKENLRLSAFPGEEISSTKENKMNNSFSYVQQWLNRNDGNISRKPFTDLNINHQSITPNNSISNFPIKTKKEDYNKVYSAQFKKNTSRSCFQAVIDDDSTITRKRKLVEIRNHCSKKVKDEMYQVNEITKDSELLKKNDNDESGIFIDESIIINDSQDTFIDKDKDACLAILEADKNEQFDNLKNEFSPIDLPPRGNSSFLNRSLQNKLQTPNNKIALRVPFYKKSSLQEKCKYCLNDLIISQGKKVKIIIECNNLITTVTVLNTTKSNTRISETSVPAQPKESEEVLEINSQLNKETRNFIEPLTNSKEDTEILSEAYETQSEDLFVDEGVHMEKVLEETSKKKKCVIIEDSDSDGDIVNSGPMHVTVDIHRSCEESEYGVLAEVANQVEHEKRPRRAPRGHTPASTESSEKENFNPNRRKRNKISKKKSRK